MVHREGRCKLHSTFPTDMRSYYSFTSIGTAAGLAAEKQRHCPSRPGPARVASCSAGTGGSRRAACLGSSGSRRTTRTRGRVDPSTRPRGTRTQSARCGSQPRPAAPPPQPRAPRQFPAPAHTCRAAPAQSGAWNEEEPTSPPVRVRVPVLSCLTAISPQWPHPHGVQPVQSVEEQQPTTCKPADTAAPAEHLTPQPRPAASHLRSSVTLGERQVQHPVCSRAGVARSEAAEDAALALAAIPVRLIDQRDDRGGAVQVSRGANHYVHLRGCGCCQARR
mmetsp:Transcript_7836/g.23574  ORF Transcript_7836/g.23574 Transcript_7836/m.23574 type:complete len:278 (+) Transcript_7836:141-974(+)